MNCHEIQSLAGPYLDSELDAKTSLAIQQHLAACPACTRRFAAEQECATRLTNALRKGEPTPELWRGIEERVRTATAPKGATRAGRERSPKPWWCAWLWPSPRFYAGVAALWIVMLAVHFGYLREPARILVTSNPPSPTVQSALAEQRRQLAEMLGSVSAPGAASATQSKLLSPRSELRQPHDQPGPTTWLLATPESLPV
jgi:anti-sigma factor RsiW